MSESLLPLGDPLYAVIVTENGQEKVRYITTEQEREAFAQQAGIDQALSLAGAWSDLDWDDMMRELDRIRHESVPTPPIEL